MMAREKKLQVKDLKVSFKTINGKVQAVRNISFDLYKGETLAIVGESGSGKSVTNRAILGILAPNAIVESGEVIYDGKDLLKITEDEFYHIRGDKISMIFQDPLSSLNPIVKIGKQMTEAMLLKGKANQKENKSMLNSYIKALEGYLNKAKNVGRLPADKDINSMLNIYKSILLKGSKLEEAYYSAKNSASNGIKDVSDLIFMLEKNSVKDLAGDVKEIVELAKASVHPYVVDEAVVAPVVEEVKQGFQMAKRGDNQPLIDALKKLLAIFTEGDNKAKISSFAKAYYDMHGDNSISLDLPLEQLNEKLEQYLENKFMKDFTEYTVAALRTADDDMVETRTAAINYINEMLAKFEADGDMVDNAKLSAFEKKSAELVEKGINPLCTYKVSPAYIYKTSVEEAIRVYHASKKNNEAEAARYAAESKKYEKLVASGKTPDWKVVPANIVDLSLNLANIRAIAERVLADFQYSMDNVPDFVKEAENFTDKMQVYAAGAVQQITKVIAKNRAIKLMEEVGIAEPRRRYNQYPFEFSGGMRQRIVIAIALSADPDVLICDEPTTALDVTIQSQILELINNIKKARNVSVIFITHDLGVVANMADRVAVMYAGKIVEIGTADEIFYEPAHPYTWALLSSMPDLDTKEKLDSIPGTPPNMIYPPVGDAFADRNRYAVAMDYKAQPPMFKISDSHYAATWLLHPQAPKVDPPKSVLDRINRMKARMEEQEAAGKEE